MDDPGKHLAVKGGEVQVMSEEEQLKAILEEPVASARKRAQSAFDEVAGPFADHIVLFGAGGLGRKTLAGLRQAGIEPVAFVDNNSQLWGMRIEGLTVLSPQEAASRFAERAVFVVTVWRAGGGHRFERTRKQLCELGCSKVVSFAALFWKYPDIFLPYYALGLPQSLLPQSGQIAQAFVLWGDSASRYEYLAQLRWRFFLDFDALPSPVAHPQYLADDLFELGSNEVVVDCGAYDGDSMRVFAEKFPLFQGKYLAIEPDPLNLKSLENCLSTLSDRWRARTAVLPNAVGMRRETLRFAATGLPSAGVSASGAFEVESLCLDEILCSEKPTFIKMDIEGAEMDALEGARNSIKQHLPVLAISVYHQPDHLWRIPLLIRSFSEQYRFFLRPHNEEGWDLVCYAVPVSRLNREALP